MGEEFVTAVKDGSLGRLILDNPPVNVLTIPVMEQAVDALADLEEDGEIKVILVEAKGEKGFSAGVDVADHTPEKMDHMLGIFDDLCMGLYRSSKPVIAAAHGLVLGGGCELIACCDMVVAADNAVFGQPEIKVGVYPILGVAFFPSFFGTKAANELLLSGRNFSAQEALSMGLVNRVVPEDRFQEEVQEFVGGFLKNSGKVMSLTKKAILAAAGKDEDAARAVAEEIYINELMKTHDANEGLAAFMEKRKPEWTES